MALFKTADGVILDAVQKTVGVLTTCTKCGFEFPITFEHCPKCGNRVSLSDTNDTNDTNNVRNID